MYKPRLLIKSSGRGGSLLIVFVSVMLMATVLAGIAFSQIGGSNDDAMLHNLVEYFIRVGTTQYERGYYLEAEKTFQMAQGYKEYLSEVEAKKLDSLLEKAKGASAGRRQVLEIKRTAEELIAKGQVTDAKAQLEKVKGSPFLTDKERMQVAQTLGIMEQPLTKPGAVGVVGKEGEKVIAKESEGAAEPNVGLNESKTSIPLIYYRSVSAYHAGDYETARMGFMRVLKSGSIPQPMAKSITGYIADIERKVGPQETGAGSLRMTETGPKKGTTEVPLTTVRQPPAGQQTAVATGIKSEDENKRIRDLFKQSCVQYSEGKLEDARKGFVETADSGLLPVVAAQWAREYIKEIDTLLVQKAVQAFSEKKKEVEKPGESLFDGQPATVQQGIRPEATTTVTATETAEPLREGGSYIDQINRRRNVIRAHTQAVVTDAVAMAHRYAIEGEFTKANEQVQQARTVVNMNQVNLGDELFKECTERLDGTAEVIATAEKVKTAQLEQQRGKEAVDEQGRLKRQMEADKQKRIADLLANAKTYQQQQRYEAAIGQLDSLLVIDPLNDEALRLKSALEDMVYLRKQIEQKKEGNKQRSDMLLKTDESSIPYAEEVTYPKNWRDIIQKPTRQPDRPIGLDPANTAAYAQLEKIVDLSSLRREMSFNEAIQAIRSAVEPPLNIVVLWRDLTDNAQIDPTTQINMDGLSQVRLGTALDNLLQAVGGGLTQNTNNQLDYVVKNGVITIATIGSLPRKRMETRVYDISDLVSPPANYQGMNMMMGGMGGYGGGMGGMGGYGGGMGGMGGYGGGMGGMGGYGGGMGGMGGYGGGMGSMGGMGGYGGGMGGMGGYGGGMGGMGGYGGGMGGMGGYGGGGGYYLAENLRRLVMESIEPDSWYEMSDTGDGTITPYPDQQPQKLAIYQTPEVHRQIDDLLDQMRMSLGHQVSIEARFLIVSENFLEDIGLDLDFVYNLGRKWGQLTFEQDSYTSAKPDVSTKVPGSMGGIGAGALVTGGYGSVLDDLQVSLLLRATQGRTDSKVLTAPRVTVLSGESASFSITDTVSYALPPNVNYNAQAGAYPGGGVQGSSVQQNVSMMPVGSVLSITPTITKDKKNVLLNIITTQQDLLRFRTHHVEGPVGTAGQVAAYDVTVPETESSQVMTRVSVPDCGTLLLGGQKITAEVEKEVGVPILSKIPVLGRAFSNRSTIRDQKILLILVKPVIILQEEREKEAIAAMEGGLQ